MLCFIFKVHDRSDGTEYGISERTQLKVSSDYLTFCWFISQQFIQLTNEIILQLKLTSTPISNSTRNPALDEKPLFNSIYVFIYLFICLFICLLYFAFSVASGQYKSSHETGKELLGSL